MPDAFWIDRDDELPALARALQSQAWIGVDTEFLRERTFFPKLCLLQLSAGGQIWCVDTLRVTSLDPLMDALTAAAARKIIHAARQDLEAVYLSTKRVISPVFDTQIAAGCIGLKPQIGYAELVKTLLDATVPKGQTRTDWSKRPLTPAQLEYAADDVLYLADVAASLSRRLAELGRDRWVLEDCLALQDKQLYEPDAAQAWARLRGLAQLAPAPRARAKIIAIWREGEARARDLPRSWLLSDAAIFSIAEGAPPPLNDSLAASLQDVLKEAANDVGDQQPSQEARPTSEQKAVIERLGEIVDARAAELNVSPEILAPRGELKALGMGARAGARRETNALRGWRREEIGTRLLEAIG
jgi:ribonuclease D